MRSQEYIFLEEVGDWGSCATNHYQLEYKVRVASLNLGMAYQSKKGMTKLFKYMYKAALYSNLQII